MLIIGLIGDQRVGKDTFADILCKRHNFVRLSFADPIKEISRIIFSFTNEQLFSDEKDIIDTRWGIAPRQFFQVFGTDVMQQFIHEHLPHLAVKPRHIWAKLLSLKLDAIIAASNASGVVITDIRFPHEMEELERHKIHYVKICRSSSTTCDISKSEEHYSIRAVEEIILPPDSRVIKNDSTLEYYIKKCNSVIEEILEDAKI